MPLAALVRSTLTVNDTDGPTPVEYLWRLEPFLLLFLLVVVNEQLTILYRHGGPYRLFLLHRQSFLLVNDLSD